MCWGDVVAVCLNRDGVNNNLTVLQHCQIQSSHNGVLLLPTYCVPNSQVCKITANSQVYSITHNI